MKNELAESKESQFYPLIADTDKEDALFAGNSTGINSLTEEADRIELLREYLRTDINNKIGSKNNANFENLNKDIEYTNLIEGVNQVQVSSFKDYIYIIKLREEAYNIGKTRELCLLLARDNHELGRLYHKRNIKQEAFNCYCKAIEYYNESYSLMECNVNYNHSGQDIAYYIGQVYHSLGDIQHLETSMRQKSYFIALAFYEISCGRKKDDMYSYYYSGMINHKLAIINNDDNQYVNLLYAEKYYTKALDFPLKNITEKNLYIYLDQIYTELISFNKRYGSKEPMLTDNEYQEKHKLMTQSVKDLEKKQIHINEG